MVVFNGKYSSLNCLFSLYDTQNHTSDKVNFKNHYCLSDGRWTRTNGLWIMIPLFYQLNYSANILTFTTSPKLFSTYGNKRGHKSNFERFGCFTFFLIKMDSLFT